MAFLMRFQACLQRASARDDMLWVLADVQLDVIDIMEFRQQICHAINQLQSGPLFKHSIEEKYTRLASTIARAQRPTLAAANHMFAYCHLNVLVYSAVCSQDVKHRKRMFIGGTQQPTVIPLLCFTLLSVSVLKCILGKASLCFLTGFCLIY